MSRAAPDTDADKTITWLVVGGAPRSGTTVLGTELSKSSQIAILHEYPSYKFFAALSRLFHEEQRQAQFADFKYYGHQIPRSSIHGPAIVQGIFAEIFPDKENLRFVGTKTPGYEVLAECEYPPWVTEKIIHITRNPYDVVLSALKKNHPGSFEADGSLNAASFKRELHHWVSAWNQAVMRAGKANFLHIFYDDLIATPEKQKRRVARFLDGVDDFDFSEFRAMREGDALERFKEAGLGKFLPLMRAVVPPESWLERAREDFAARRKYTTPLPFVDRAGSWLFRRLLEVRKRLLHAY